MKLRLHLYLLLVGAISVARADVTVREAWEILNRPSFSLAQPNLTYLRPDETEALEVLKRNPAETERLVVSALGKGGDRRNAMTIFGLVINRTESLRVVRKIVSTYPPLDPSNPEITFLAGSGEGEDMKILKLRIASAPDSDASISLAALMVDNPNAHDALLELKDTAPGKWQEWFSVKKFFAMKAGAWPPRSAPETDSRGKAGPAAAVKTLPSLPSSPTNAVSTGRPKTETAGPPHMERNWWIWMSGLAAVVIAVAFLARRIR